MCSPETCRSTAPEQETGGGKYSQREKRSMERFAAFLGVIAISRPYKNTISIIAKNKKTPYFNCLQAPWRWRDISGSRFVLFFSSTTTSRSLSLRRERDAAVETPQPASGLSQKRPCLAESRSLESAGGTSDLGTHHFTYPLSPPSPAQSVCTRQITQKCFI